MKDNNDKGIAGFNISINFNGKTYSRVTDKNGQAKLLINSIPGNYTADFNFAGDNFYLASSKSVKFVVKKATPKIIASPVSTVYNGGKYLIATLKDQKNNVIKNAKISIKLNGAIKYLTTDSKGQVKLSTNGLAPKTYTATISFSGDKCYNKISKTVKITVTKATPKMTANAKTYKLKPKSKTYAITLKDNNGKVMKNSKVTLKVNNGKVMKNSKVTLKVNKKTFTAKTNSKGVASFKISNLNKKGTFTAVVSYAGSKYYNKISKKPKITIK